MADAPVPYPVAARVLLRSTLLDAMREELATREWASVTMAEVARAAGVSRQTLYKAFGSRQEFAQAYVLREVDRFLEAVEAAVQAHLDEPAMAVSAAFDVFLAAAADDPLVRSIVSGESSDELLPLVTTQGQPVLEHATERLAAFLDQAWPTIAPEQARLLAECVVRLAISCATLPSGPAGMGADSVATLLGPYLERVLA
ncbi:MAG: TetR family transcriptional regulator [Actinomycetota bacterium]|nr:TetR family transcriptional regulator [Actinomycetota bacterium]